MLDVTPFFFFFFNDTATTEIYTLSLHDALPISHLTEKLREHHALGISRETVRRYREQLGHPPKRARRAPRVRRDRKSTRLNSSHLVISYAVFCLKKKKTNVHR